MKLFSRRKAEVRDNIAELGEQMNASPGEWFPFPDNLALRRESFEVYDVKADTTGVWIRRKPHV
ncbi:hypothetical protein [Mycolicibacterium mucogenicum]|uniref:Uncharacterized protein n=1 Tax=Mycolicibacterium mucogenicum DSM 44124 TaxID=1226753 RepID=A0A8H2PEB0_MYCMU|nr:hypothetical protein [Mycolicibacterium mucogenicum]KAB7761780.1 hypothetical protein MMUC44124_01050 [Mycolicibacterium mucogenicum DSM 44124]QPG70016.1 hypothetical protein C1S78_003025 [Mycolicibacterium mucogenicum DSM 44124]